MRYWSDSNPYGLTWRGAVERETKTLGKNWREMKLIARNPMSQRGLRTRRKRRMYCMSHHCIPNKITVWCGLWAGGGIGPYFLPADEDRHVTVNRYRSMITEYFWPQLDDMDMWFQQDGAQCDSPLQKLVLTLKYFFN